MTQVEQPPRHPKPMAAGFDPIPVVDRMPAKNKPAEGELRAGNPVGFPNVHLGIFPQSKETSNARAAGATNNERPEKSEKLNLCDYLEGTPARLNARPLP